MKKNIHQNRKHMQTTSETLQLKQSLSKITFRIDLKTVLHDLKLFYLIIQKTTEAIIFPLLVLWTLYEFCL